MEKDYHLLSVKPDSYQDNSSCHDWSNESSTSSYTDTESSEAEWEESVDSFGELLYIECHPRVAVSEIGSRIGDREENEEKPPNLSRSATRRSNSSRGKLARLIRRRESKRHSKRSYTDAYAASETTVANKVTFRDCQEGEVRQVVVRVDPANKHRFGRRTSLMEAMLGISASTFSDPSRIMVAGLVPDGEASKNRVKIGEWLKRIDDADVTHQNVDEILESVTEPRNVRLTLQRIAGAQVTDDRCSSDDLLSDCRLFALEEELSRASVAVVYIDVETDAVVYCYPPTIRDGGSTFVKNRGAFVTLSHLLSDAIREKPPRTTSIAVDGGNNKIVRVVHGSYSGRLLLMALPGDAREARQIFDQVTRTLTYCYGSLDACFAPENESRLDRYLTRFFGASVDLQSTSSPAVVRFEQLLPAAQSVTLPREALMQLDDALNELEAGDYRDWNADPLDCQRLFTVIGSAFYHSGYLLASHLTRQDAVDVHLFCRQMGLFRLSRSEPVRTLVVWKRVYPSLFRSESRDCYALPRGAWFLLVVGNSKDLLTVLMEAGGCTSPPDQFQTPDVFYVEEAQETLKHVQNLGIPALADKWLELNLRPRVARLADATASKMQKRLDFMGFIKNPGRQQPVGGQPLSILKRRSPVRNVSEDSTSQETHSEMSDEPVTVTVVGRKQTREQRFLLDSDDSDSDWENCRPDSEIGGYFDAPGFKRLADAIPSKLSAGIDNVLYHYVRLDATEGVLLCPPVDRDSSEDPLLSNFRKTARVIHALFENTIRFKNMLANNMAKAVVNKSLIAIKEYGLSFECAFQEPNKKSGALHVYWVIGRLFYAPHPTEFYVCYHDSVPQNLIEMAFRLNMNAS